MNNNEIMKIADKYAQSISKIKQQAELVALRGEIIAFDLNTKDQIVRLSTTA